MQTEKRGNLVLSRFPDESIEIGEVTVTIVEVRGDQVRLAIKAPKHVEVMRTELGPKRKGKG